MQGHPSAVTPAMLPWLFPYGLGGIGNDMIPHKISTMAHKRLLLMYHDKRFQITSPLSLRRDSFITLDLDDFFSALTLNLAFLPRKLMVSHTQEIL